MYPYVFIYIYISDIGRALMRCMATRAIGESAQDTP